MPFTPQTVVYLLNVPLEEDQKNQLDFASVSAQTTYFLGKQLHAYTDFTYQRKDGVIRVPAEIDSIYNCNYVMYQNSNFTGKWFYAFITKMEYINANMTALTIKTDVFQTWLFDFSFLPSFVAREHVADDTVWKHTLAEPLATPEYVYNSVYSLTYDSTPGNTSTSWVYCAYATPDSGSDKIRPRASGSSTEYTNYTIGHMRTSGYLFGADNYADFKELIETLIHENYTISYTITLPGSHVYPLDAVEWNGTYQSITYPFKIYADALSSETDSINLSAVNTATIGTHTVRNKKINCYPFRMMQITDDCKQKINLKYELLNPVHDTSATWLQAFKIRKTAGSAPASTLYPRHYADKSADDYSNSITLSSFPPVPYAIDYFSQYLALHKSSFAVEQIRETFGMAAGVGAGAARAATGGIAGGAEQITGSILGYSANLARYEDMKNAPPGVHNAPSGEPKYYMNGLRFRIYDVHPTTEYIEYIESFFDRYGYNVSETKTPQFNSRPSWNYLETREVNLAGNIPQDDANELKNIFNSGLTVWHDPAHFGDYTRNNAPT